ncbi:lysophospholipid acyltransferase family protein [Myxococcota bacterium]|nr:lysophospholipid acyltransferase family protein [Myxococcota bacterium]
MGRRVLGLVVGAISFLYLVFVLNTIQTLSILLKPFSRRAFRAVNRWCARSIWGFWVLQAELLNGIEVRFTGERVPARENGLILANHQSMADVLSLLCFAWRCQRIGDMKWFVKDVLKYFPGVGWGMLFLDCVFVKRDWARDRDGIHRLFDKYKREQIPLFLISFLEGTRLTPKKLAASQQHAREKGLPVPEHTLIPRTRGFVATMLGLRDHLDAVYDVTIGYPGRVPGLVDCFGARVSRIELHVRRFAIDTLPTDEEALADWAMARFREKDALMKEFTETGRFPGTPWPDRVRVVDWLLPEGRSRISDPGSRGA